jgi:serine/threonine protein kinase
MYIFMEYCDEGTLEEVSRLGLQEHVIRLYSKQTTTAINVLHEHGIVHRDIKGQLTPLTGEMSFSLVYGWSLNSMSGLCRHLVAVF